MKNFVQLFIDYLHYTSQHNYYTIMKQAFSQFLWENHFGVKKTENLVSAQNF